MFEIHGYVYFKSVQLSGWRGFFGRRRSDADDPRWELIFIGRSRNDIEINIAFLDGKALFDTKYAKVFFEDFISGKCGFIK
jgi:hypothetical protein